tara:strand:+ start:1335 stop:1742 length:408 start_codon:yes stop_codon:yes gene_type:complete
MEDPFLLSSIVVKRLTEEWIEHGGLIIAYDFDNTVFDFHNKGYTFDGVIRLLRQCEELGCKFICFTARSKDNYKEVEDHILENNIPCDGINIDILDFGDVRKPYYNILLDDRAGLRSSMQDLESAYCTIKQIKEI